MTGALAGLGHGRHDLWIGVELTEEGLEEVGWHQGVIGEPSMGGLPGDAIDGADLRPGHSRCLRVEKNPALERADAGGEVMDGPYAVASVR